MSGAPLQDIRVLESQTCRLWRWERQVGSINITIEDPEHALNTTTIHFDGPQFIVNSGGQCLDLNTGDKYSVISHSFHGGANQQWLLYYDGHGEVLIMSLYNQTYAAPQNIGLDAGLVSRHPPFYWRLLKDGGGYRLGVPDSELGLSLGVLARLRPLHEDSRTSLFILENNAENRASIKTLDIFQSGPKTTRSSKKAYKPGLNINIITVNNDKTSKNAADTLTNLQNLITVDGVRYFGTSVGQHLVPDPSISTSTVSNSFGGSSNGVTGHNNSRTRKLTISQIIPVPTASPGVADIVGFGASGVVIVRNTGKLQKYLVVPNFGYDAGGWRTEKHVRLLADTTGNRRADIVGFGESHVWISFNNGDNTFKQSKQVTPEFSYSAGWRVDKHLRFMADIRNTGRADIVGFGDTGVLISSNNGDGSFGPARLALGSFGYNAGDWRIEKHLRFLADVDGRGVLDIVGFGQAQVRIARNNGDGTFQSPTPILADLCYSQGWRVDKHPRFAADLTGDGKLDLVGFGDDGVWVAFNNGDGTFQPAHIVLDRFCGKTGWRMEDHLRFIIDLTGDGCGDIIGIHQHTVSVAINNGNGTFEAPKHFPNVICHDPVWKVNKHPRFVADMTGDGRPDIVSFCDKAVYISYNDGKGNFGPEVELVSGFGANDAGWSPENSVKYVANLHA